MGQKVDHKDLIKGKIYVTRGGIATLANEKTVGWGFDRVRLLNISETRITVQTPWNTEVSLPLDYTLYDTSDTILRNEFNILTIYKEKKELTFDEALKIGLCKEVKKKKSYKIGRVKSDDLVKDVIKFFLKENSLSKAEEEFVLSKVRIKGILRQASTVGVDGQRYVIKKKKNKLEKRSYLYKITPLEEVK